MAIAYTITAVEGDVLTVEYADGSWAQFRVTENMTQENVDDLAHQFAPKPVGLAPAFLAVGNHSVAAPMPIPEPAPLTADELRRAAYEAEADPIFFKWQRGEATEQEWLDKVAEITTLKAEVAALKGA